MASPVWKVGYCRWDAEGQPPGQVKVASLSWSAELVEGEFDAARTGGTLDDQNRVYTLAALQNVPQSVMVGWAKQALGPTEVTRIEAEVNADLEAQKTPTEGGFVPG